MLEWFTKLDPAAYDDMMRVVTFFGGGLFGMYCHYRKRFRNGQTTRTFKDFFVKGGFNTTADCLLVLMLGAAAFVASGWISNIAIMGVTAIGFLAGFVSDSVFQKPKLDDGSDNPNYRDTNAIEDLLSVRNVLTNVQQSVFQPNYTPTNRTGGQSSAPIPHAPTPTTAELREARQRAEAARAPDMRGQITTGN